MARTEEGEYEFVVGNKHLLSAVFVLMVLFGIFFSLGYFVGRSGDGVAAPAQQAAAPAARTGVPQPQEQPAAPAVDSPVNPGEAQVARTPEGTQPATPPAGEAKPEPQPSAPAEPARGAASEASGPQPGQTFLQVAAVKQSEARVIVDVLKAKGFNAMVAPAIVNGVPSDTLFRALVGPVKDAADLARLKSELQAAGFRPYVQKY